jgi:hypothetical protein
MREDDRVTEEEWLEATDPRPLLQRHLLELHLRKAIDRKLRLFAVACCSRMRHLLTAPGVQALRLAERLAEGLASIDDCSRWCDQGARRRVEPDPVKDWSRPPARVTVYEVASRHSWEAAYRTAQQTAHMGSVEAVRVRGGEWLRHWSKAMATQYAALTKLLRDIFGNPFRPVRDDPSWLTLTVRTLAEGIYADRVFDRLPILADALQDAGCENDEILTHCRGDGPHVRGCWVVDLVLGKE